MPELSDKQLRERRQKKAKVLALLRTPPPQPQEPAAPPTRPPVLPAYAELHCLSNFSFQRGASHPEELVERAYRLGYSALALTDECSVAGVVRAHVGLRELLEAMDEHDKEHPEAPPQPRNEGFRFLPGSEFDFGRFKLVALVHDLEGWGNLCEFITAARTSRRAAPKASTEARQGVGCFVRAP